MLSRCLLAKTSASELSRKFIKSECVAGWDGIEIWSGFSCSSAIVTRGNETHGNPNKDLSENTHTHPHTHKKGNLW